MKLFCWNSKFMQDYSDGYIIVMAETIEDAKDYARKAAPAKWCWYSETLASSGMSDYDNDDKEEYEKFMKLLEEDLAKEPRINNTFFIVGGG